MKHSISRWTLLSCCLAVVGAVGYGESEAFDTGGSVALGALSQRLAAGQIVTFKNTKSRLCIGVDGASTSNGALLKQFKCDDGAPNQSWQTSRRGFEHTLINVKSRKCMGVDRASVNPGANIGQFNCGNGAPNQAWILISDTEDLVSNLQNAKSGLCIGVDGASTANGAQLKQFPCNLTAPNQEWRLIIR